MTTCDHDWENSPIVLDFNPPIYSRRCLTCGQQQQQFGYIDDETSKTFPTEWFDITPMDTA